MNGPDAALLLHEIAAAGPTPARSVVVDVTWVDVDATEDPAVDPDVDAGVCPQVPRIHVGDRAHHQPRGPRHEYEGRSSMTSRTKSISGIGTGVGRQGAPHQ